MVNITVKGDRELVIALDRIRNATPKTLLDIISRSAYAVEREAKENVSRRILNVRSGRLRASIKSLIRKGDSPSARIGPNVIYAPVHEFGATIRAKRAKYLKFRIPNVGWRQKKQVTIPARPFMATAFKDCLPKIDRIMNEEINKLVR